MAAEECSRLPNIPGINDSRTLVDLIGQMRDEMRVSITQIRNEIGVSITQMRDEMRTLSTQTTERFDLLQTEMTILRSDVTAIHTRLDAR